MAFNKGYHSGGGSSGGDDAFQYSQENEDDWTLRDRFVDEFFKKKFKTRLINIEFQQKILHL